MSINEEPKSYSIIIVPSDHSGTRQFRVSRTMLLLSASLLVMLTLVVVTFAATHLGVLRTARKVGQVELENAQLREDVAMIDELAHELELLSAQRAQILNMLGREEMEAVADNGALSPMLLSEDDPLGDVEKVQQLFADGARRGLAPRTWPVDGAVLREYLPEPEGGLVAHPGLTIEVLAGEAVRASGRGRVVESGLSDSGEPFMVLDHGYGFRTLYAGFARPLVELGQIIERQQAIAEFDEEGSGQPDRAGQISGPALYFEIRVDGLAIDPREYLTPRQGRRRGS